MFDRLFTRIATIISAFAGQPAAFVLAAASVVVWGVTGPLFSFSETWQLVINTGTTIVTCVMVFLIQNSHNRDSAAMQAKLDELVRAVEGARDEFIGIEHLTDRQIQRILAKLERETGEARDPRSKSASIARLQERL